MAMRESWIDTFFSRTDVVVPRRAGYPGREWLAKRPAGASGGPDRWKLLGIVLRIILDCK
jgi:hypothetical protein